MNVFTSIRRFFGDILRGLNAVLTMLLPRVAYVYHIRVPVVALLFFLAVPVLCWLGPLRTLTVGAFEVYGFMDSFLFTVMIAISCGGIEALIEAYQTCGRTRYPNTGKATRDTVRMLLFACYVVAAVNLVWMSIISLYGASGSKWWGIVGGVACGVGACFLFRWILNRVNSNWLPVKRLATQFFVWIQGTGRSMDGVIMLRRKPACYIMIPGVAKIGTYTTILLVTYLVFLIFASEKVLSANVAPIGYLYFIATICMFIFSILTFIFDRHRLPLMSILVLYMGFTTLWKESDHYYSIHKQNPMSGQEKEDTVSLAAVSTQPQKMATDKLPTPGEVLSLYSKRAEMKANGTVVVVTMAGGGIQAAAWPLVALQKIEEQQKGFHESIALISGVSGGSVGAMYYTAAYSGEGNANAEFRPCKASDAAMESSLRQLSFSMLKDDLIKALIPAVYAVGGKNLLRDRGLALEQSFLSAGQKYDLFPQAVMGMEADSELIPTLHSWGVQAGGGYRPALIMNATEVESGKRMAFSTVPCKHDAGGTIEFFNRFPLADMSVTTAARLSATFPAISPAARPVLTDGMRVAEDVLPKATVTPGSENWGVFPKGGSYHHVVDGGYFENSGLAGAMIWLNEALEEIQLKQKARDATATVGAADMLLPRRLIILEISAFPELHEAAARAVDEGVKSKGTLFDLVTPLQTVVNLRGAVQEMMSEEMVKMFVKRWHGRETVPDNEVKMDVTLLKVRPIIDASEWEKSPIWNIGAQANRPPLSWHLRQCEIDAIKKQVQSNVNLLRHENPESLKGGLTQASNTKVYATEQDAVSAASDVSAENKFDDNYLMTQEATLIAHLNDNKTDEQKPSAYLNVGNGKINTYPVLQPICGALNVVTQTSLNTMDNLAADPKPYRLVKMYQALLAVEDVQRKGQSPLEASNALGKYASIIREIQMDGNDGKFTSLAEAITYIKYMLLISKK